MMANHPLLRAKLFFKLLPLVVGPVALHPATGLAQNTASHLAKGAMPTSIGLKSSVPQWQTAAGGTMSFEVASVRQNKTGGKSSMNVDPTNGDHFTPTGGLYVAKNIPLAEFVAFAYKLTNRQLGTFESQVPWSLNDLFDIEARADGNPTKDQYRLMMQSLLADRFKMAIHFETREVPVYALVLAKSGDSGRNSVCIEPMIRHAPQTHRPQSPNAADSRRTRMAFRWQHARQLSKWFRAHLVA
jgi:uncharacterized protein (TIGR03435 family)